jgi:hypothetical protein
MDNELGPNSKNNYNYSRGKQSEQAAAFFAGLKRHNLNRGEVFFHQGMNRGARE